MSIELNGASEDTPVIDYTPDFIDEYMVIVNSPEDWETVHNYIINENEIDGIPNRKINCSNVQEFSLRTAIYEMSAAEAESLKRYSKIETVELNPDKYPQPQSIDSARFGNVVAFNKPLLPAALDAESIAYKNGVRSNWSMLFVNNPSSEPFQGVGISTVDYVERDIPYSMTGRHVDAVTIDTGMGILHPEFLSGDGTHRVFDVILDGPYKVDPDFFNADPSNRLETVTIDSVVIGTRAKESVARDWWANTGTSYRSAAYSSVGTVSISSSYTRIHAHSKNGTNAVSNSHGTSCASQIGGKSFGLAYECNLWNIRIVLGGAGGVIGSDTALNACTIWHKAKKIQSTDPDPTLVNNSYGGSASTGNDNGTSYSHSYRGNSLTYTGSGAADTVPSNAGACRNHKYFTYNVSGSSGGAGYSGDGQYTTTGSTTNTAAENAIAAGCIMVSSAGNTNQKLSDKNDVDFDNWYSNSSNYINRVGGVQQGFSGDHDIGKGCIRVGAIDCAVEPADEKQGATKYSIRKVCYSANGPMVDIFAPAEKSMSAAYASSEDYQRNDDSNFYDTWFNGTSSAGPNVCSLIALYLQSNRRANQDNVRHWLYTDGSKDGLISDPYSGINVTGYWSQSYNASTDEASNINESYNYRGNGNLRGAANRVLFNPYASDIIPSFSHDDDVDGTVVTENIVLHYDAANVESYSGIGTVINNLGPNQSYKAYIAGSLFSYSSNPKAFVNNTAGNNSNFTDGIYIDGLNYVTGDADAFSNMSIECWCNLKSGSSGNTYDHRIILSYDRSAVFRFSIGFDGASAAAGKPSLQWMNNSTIIDNWADTYSGDLRDDEWHQVGVTFTTSAVKYYVDGVNVDTHTGSWSPMTNHAESETPRYGWIGNGSEAATPGTSINPPGLFYGSIANLKYYYKTLSDAEMQQNYNALKHRFSSSGISTSSVPFSILGSFGGENIITSDLVLNLDANNYTSGSTWTDISGQSNNGTINGATYNSGDGGYFIFDGTNDYVSLPAGSDFAYGTGNFTVETWFNVTGTSPEAWGEILFSQLASGHNYFLVVSSEFNPVQKKPGFIFGTGGSGTKTLSSTTYTEGTWHHFVVTRNGTTVTLYLDNSSVGTVTCSQDFTNTTYVPTIGSSSGGGNLWFDGKIAQMRVYKGRGFSSSDVTQNYNAMKGRYSSSSLSILQT